MLQNVHMLYLSSFFRSQTLLCYKVIQGSHVVSTIIVSYVTLEVEFCDLVPQGSSCQEMTSWQLPKVLDANVSKGFHADVLEVG